MAKVISPIAPAMPAVTAIQDPAVRRFAQAVTDALNAQQSAAAAVELVARAAGAMGSGGSGGTPPIIADWLYKSELYGKLSSQIESVDLAWQQGLLDEAVQRAQDLAAEAAARAAEITAEAELRMQGDANEALLRANALAAEAAARAQDLADEATARALEIAWLEDGIDIDRAGLEVLAQASTLYTGASIVTEQTARADAISAEANSREVLAAQVRGDYEGNDLSQVTTGLLYQERLARANADESLSQQITLLSAGAGEEFDWAEIWYFDAGVEGWTGNGTPTTSAGWIRAAAHASDPYLVSPDVLGVATAQYGQVRLRVRKVGTPTWEGYLWWQGPGDSTWDAARREAISEPSLDGNGIGVITLNPAWTGTVDQIRFDLSAASDGSNYYEIDWVAMGRPAPGASSAQLYDEATARAAADAAEVTARQALSAKLTGLNDPSGATLGGLTAGLLFDERTARVAQDSALSSSISSLSATVTNNYNTLNSAITAEQTARANADTAETTARQTLATTLVGTADLSGLTLAGIASGLLADERNARVSADASEVTARQTLAATLTGFSDPTGQPLANLTTGLIADERNARVTQDSALASSISSLSASLDTLDQTVTAAIAAEELARVDADGALTSSISAANVRIDDAEASILAEETARVSADNALTSSLNALTATVADNTAAIVLEQTVRADADATFANQFDALTAEFEWQDETNRILQLGSGVQTEASQLRAEAALTTERTVRADQDGALTQQINTAVSRIDTTEAAIVDEQTTRATNDSALVEAINTMWGAVGTSQALIQSGDVVQVNYNAATANKWGQLEAEVFTAGGQTIRAALAEEATVRANQTGELYGQYTVKIDTSTPGKTYVAGFGLASEANEAGESTSIFIIRADKFAVVSPGFGEHVPFAIGPGGPEFLGTLQWDNVFGAGRPEDGATVGAPPGTEINGVPVEDVTTAIEDFNASNNRSAAAISAPTIPTDGSAVDHTNNSDGSSDISFEWQWSGSEGSIDGFRVYVRQSTTATPYTFGTAQAEEQVYSVPAAKRALILYGMPADRYYTFGVQAYRKVDPDVAANGLIVSSLVKATGSGENPYQPSSSVAFAGNVTGTVGGTPAGNVNQWASIFGTGKPQDNATVGATIGANLNRAGGGIASATDFVATWNRITGANIATYIANAAIGSAAIADAAIINAKIADAAITTAKIADATITKAKIGVAEIDTLRVAGNAITVPVSASGTTSATTAAANFDGQPVVLMCFGTSSTNNASSQITVTLKRGATTLLTREVGTAFVAGDGEPYRYAIGTLLYLDNPGAGSHSYSVTVSGSGGTYNPQCIVVALGVKR